MNLAKTRDKKAASALRSRSVRFEFRHRVTASATASATSFFSPRDDSRMDRYDDVDTDAGDGEVVTTELHYSPDVLVKAFALGPGAAVEPHEHPEQTNVFHVLEGDLVVVRGDAEERVSAPAVVPFERGVPHGARNENDETAVFTATMGPME